MDAGLQRGSELCLKCALCCDGSLFLKAHLHPEELENARSLGMTVSGDGEVRSFALPCHLLREKSCTIYDSTEYPRACGGFKCKLLNRYLAAEIDLKAALGVVRSAREMLADMQQLAPFGSDRPMTVRGLRVLTAYLFTLPQQARAAHAQFFKLVAQYIRLVTREFVQLEEALTSDPLQAVIVSA